MAQAQPAAPALTAAAPPPNWVASRHPLGWLIDRLLAVEPLRRLLFLQARQLIIRTAERRGIAWRARREELVLQAEPLLASSTDAATQVPAYYRARFHAYQEGNLCWQAAGEAEQATDAMALRVWPGETLEPQDAQRRLRDAIFAAIEPSLTGPVHSALDIAARWASAPWPSRTGWSGVRAQALPSTASTSPPRCWRWPGSATPAAASAAGTTPPPKPPACRRPASI